MSHIANLGQAAFLKGLEKPLTATSRATATVTPAAKSTMSSTKTLPGSNDSEELEEDDETEEEISVQMKEYGDAGEVQSGKLLLKARAFIGKVRILWDASSLRDLPVPQKIRRSPGAKQFFQKCCEEKGLKQLVLLPYVKTRWGSWAAVFERLLELKEVYIIIFRLFYSIC
jgi:hypothetical protein